MFCAIRSPYDVFSHDCGGGACAYNGTCMGDSNELHGVGFVSVSIVLIGGCSDCFDDVVILGSIHAFPSMNDGGVCIHVQGH